MLERLQKIISRAGIASRRHAEDLIRSGQVRVNGVVITELGAKADPERDRVEAAGRVAQLSETHVYLLMNKPPEVVSTLADPEGRRTLRNFLVGVSERVFPVGRLDYAAGGAVFLTNDGEFANRMLKASPSLPQTYWIKVKGRLNESQLKTLAYALQGKVFPLRAPHAAGKNPPNPWYEAQLSGARRDLLRRNLLVIGHPVEKMKRMKLASLDADTVPEGHYRQLTTAEVAKLVHAVDYALKQPKPVLVSTSPRRAWRPRRDMDKPNSNPKPDSRPNLKSAPNLEPQFVPKFEPGPNFRPKPEFNSDPNFKSQSKFRSKPGFKSEPSFRPKPQFKSDPNFKSESKFRSKSGFKSEPGFRPKPQFKSDPNFKSESEFRSKSGFKSKPSFRPKPEFKSDRNFKSKSEFRSKPGFRSKPKFASNSNFKPKSNFKPPHR